MLESIIDRQFLATNRKIYLPCSYPSSNLIIQHITTPYEKTVFLKEAYDAELIELEAMRKHISMTHLKASNLIASKGKIFFDGLAILGNQIFVLSKRPSDTRAEISGKFVYLKQLRKSRLIIKMEFERYQMKIKRKINKIKRNQFYDKKENIGVLIHSEKFYAYSIQKPFTLYERRNNKYYQFSKVYVGVEITEEKGMIAFGRPVVINNYTHPALKKRDTPFQEICLEEALPVYTNAYSELKRILYKAMKSLTSGYMSQYNAWHPLTDNFYFTPSSNANPKEATNI